MLGTEWEQQQCNIFQPDKGNKNWDPRALTHIFINFEPPEVVGRNFRELDDVILIRVTGVPVWSDVDLQENTLTEAKGKDHFCMALWVAGYGGGG